MFVRTRRTGVFVVTLFLAGAVATACGGSDDMAAPSAASSPSPTASNGPDTGAPGGPRNAADAAFASSMIPHHLQAIEMSEIVLAKNGLDAKIGELAQNIRAEQGPEVELMTNWLSAWGEPVPDTDAGGTDHSAHGMPGTPGMMSAEEMATLQAASGADAGRLFLEMMIEHHEGAIAMARTELAEGHSAEAKKLAEQIIHDQQAEIVEMQQVLGQ